jgi:hypothetical protein
MSAESHDPQVDILVKCRNKNCTGYNQTRWIPPTLPMAPGEEIYCGGCGYPTVFFGPNRPDRSLPFDAERMNKVTNKGDGDLDEDML